MVCEWIDAKRPWSACSEFYELPPFAVVLREHLRRNLMRLWAALWQRGKALGQGRLGGNGSGR